MMSGISCNNSRVPTKGGLVIKDIFAKMAFQMAKKWPVWSKMAIPKFFQSMPCMYFIPLP